MGTRYSQQAQGQKSLGENHALGDHETAMTRDGKKLMEALRRANATLSQSKMAAILLVINGLENALEFVEKLEDT